MVKAFLDDEADWRMQLEDFTHGKTFDVVWDSSEMAITWMKVNGCPDYISFDHDLGFVGNTLEKDTAMCVVNWMIDTDMLLGGKFIPKAFDFNVHSLNYQGARNIESKLLSYLKVKGQ